jgi:hypothetical protein
MEVDVLGLWGLKRGIKNIYCKFCGTFWQVLRQELDGEEGVTEPAPEMSDLQ